MQLATEVATSQHTLPALDYPTDALAPSMSRETVEIHYRKHHGGYVDKLNVLIRGTQFASSTLEEIVRKSYGPIFNNAAQAWNHAFFWKSLSPRGGGDPGGELGRRIRETFGGADALRQIFAKSATEKFGSGWTWLVCTRDGRLAVSNTDDADTPLRSGDRPLLACDVWEHAYYLDYRNDRARYLDAFWRIANWKFAEENLARRRP